MSKLIAVVGPSGTGKSASMENLSPEQSYIINVTGQPLPFRGSLSKWNSEKKNSTSTADYRKIIQLLKGISDKREDIKEIIIDDAGYIMATEFFQRSAESGYGKFAEIGQHMFEVISTAASLREDLVVVFFFHDEPIYAEGQAVTRKIKTIGKMLEDKFTPEALFTTLLYSGVDETEEGLFYHFKTRYSKSYPAKSPRGMFEEEKIPNDLAEILNKVREYYK